MHQNNQDRDPSQNQDLGPDLHQGGQNHAPALVPGPEGELP